MKGQITMIGIIIAAICMLIVFYVVPTIDSVFNSSKTGNSFIDAVAGMAIPLTVLLLPIIFLILTTTRSE